LQWGPGAGASAERARQYALGVVINPRPLARFLSLLLLFIAATLHGCDDDSCGDGEVCECAEGTACYLDCEGSGCDQYCHNVDRCGTVCDDDCAVRCHDMQDCSAVCEANCTVSCAAVDKCGAICGPGCVFDCSNSGQCSARVGPGSTIDCGSASSCTIECDGPCVMHCNNVASCSLDCLDGGPTSCGSGTQACGACPS
jgi:hypothetical protein